jgi:MFS family permease
VLAPQAWRLFDKTDSSGYTPFMRAAQFRVFFLFTAAYFLSYFYRSANAIIAPDLSQEMGLGAAQLGLMTSLFFAAFAAVQLPLGVGLDAIGPRWMTPLLMLVGVVGSIVFALAPSYVVLALGRALIGVGMAGVLMGALKMFGAWFPAQRYSTMSGLLVGIGSTGALVAATPLAWINTNYGWRSVFVGGAAAILVIATAIMLTTSNTPPGVEWPGRQAGGGSLADVLHDTRFWRIATLVFFTNGTLLAFQGLWAGPYLFDVYGLDKIGAGNRLFWLSLGVVVGALLSGWLADRIGLVKIVVIGALGLIASLIVLAFHPPLWSIAVVNFLFGMSGAFTVLLLAQPRFIFPRHLTGRAATAINVFAIGGTFILQWLMGVIIGSYPVDGGGHYPAHAYTVTLLTMAAGMAVALVWYAARPILNSQ